MFWGVCFSVRGTGICMCEILCVSLQSKKTGCSAARLAHLLWEQRVASSNPATPTFMQKKKRFLTGYTFLRSRFLFLLSRLGVG